MLSILFLFVLPLNADSSLGWEGVSFGLVINKYEENFTTIRFEDLYDNVVEGISINTGRKITDPQFRILVSSNVNTSDIWIELTFEPFYLQTATKKSELYYDVRLSNEEGTPVKLLDGTSDVNRLSVVEEKSVLFSPGKSDGSVMMWDFPVSLEFDSQSLLEAMAGVYQCNLVAKVIAI